MRIGTLADVRRGRAVVSGGNADLASQVAALLDESSNFLTDESGNHLVGVFYG